MKFIKGVNAKDVSVLNEKDLNDTDKALILDFAETNEINKYCALALLRIIMIDNNELDEIQPTINILKVSVLHKYKLTKYNLIE